MSLADRAEGPPPRTIHGSPCSVGTLLAQLDDTERKGFQTLLDDRRWTATAIREAVVEEGYEVGHQTIGRHRLRKCRCFA